MSCLPCFKGSPLWLLHYRPGLSAQSSRGPMYLESRHNSLLISHALRPLLGLIIVKHPFLFHEPKAHTHQETKGSFEDESWDNPGPWKITSWKFSKYWNYCVPFREVSVDLTLGIGYQKQTSLKPGRGERTLRKRWNKYTAHTCPFTRACHRDHLHISCLIWFPQPLCEIVTNSILILKVSKLRFSEVMVKVTQIGRAEQRLEPRSFHKKA